MIRIDRHPRIALTLVVAFLGAAGLASIPPLDRDEPDFAQGARQMLESRNFVDIRFQDAPLYEKPILTYWAQAGSAALFSTSPERNRIWVYRLPSVFAVWVAVLLTYELGLTLFERRTALAAAMLFASMLLVQSQAHQARADALLLAAMLGSVLPLARMYAPRHSLATPPFAGMIALFWVSLAAAILIKGPVVPGLVALAVATLGIVDRSWRWLAPLRSPWGILLFLLVLLPWPLAMLRQHGVTFFVEAWETDILPKLVSSQESHGAPPLTYALSSPLTLWPATLLLPWSAELAWRNRRDPSVRFCIALMLPGWLIFELAPTKLPHYVLPLVPLLALLMTVRASQSSLHRPSRISSKIGVALFLLTAFAIVGAIVMASKHLGSGLDAITLAGVLPLLGAVVITGAIAWRRGVEQSVAAVTLCGMLASLVIFGITMPRLQRLWITERAAQAAHTVSAPDSPTVVVGYREPSLVFLLGTRTRFLDAAAAAAALQARSSRVAIVADPEAPAFAAAARARGVDLRPISTIAGIDPVHGRPITLSVWSRRDIATPSDPAHR